MSVAEIESREVMLEAQGGLWSEAFARLRRNPGATSASVLVALFVITALVRAAAAPYDPRAQDLNLIAAAAAPAPRLTISSVSTTSAGTSCRASSSARGSRC